ILRAYRGIGPGYALYWDAVTAAFRRGCARLDLGRCTRGGGAWSFKRQWLAEEGELPWYGFPAPLRLRSPAGAEARQGRLPSMTAALWSRLPAKLANRPGPALRAATPNCPPPGPIGRVAYRIRPDPDWKGIRHRAGPGRPRGKVLPAE